MNKIQKPIDYSDINSFLPETFGSAQFWSNKISGLPNGYPELFESMSRIEHNDETTIKIINKIQQDNIDFKNKMELEFKDRETKTNLNIIDDENKQNRFDN